MRLRSLCEGDGAVAQYWSATPAASSDRMSQPALRFSLLVKGSATRQRSTRYGVPKLGRLTESRGTTIVET